MTICPWNNAHMSKAPEFPLIHPEEMRADFDLPIGKRINLKGTVRATPAGLTAAVAAGYPEADSGRTVGQ
jgi:hypothetical protein